MVAAKLALYAMREQGLSKVGLAARMGVSEGAAASSWTRAIGRTFAWSKRL